MDRYFQFQCQAMRQIHNDLQEYIITYALQNKKTQLAKILRHIKTKHECLKYSILLLQNTHEITHALIG